MANRLEKEGSPTQDLDAELIERYSTGAIFDRVKAIYKSKAEGWDCIVSSGLMRYFRRWDEQYYNQSVKAKSSGCPTESVVQ